ncbi:uncharacterized protein [Glycine max]|uniref:uncharacterized protein n=1 Tax=Glycine max TaxID=3847 RepID=UPI0007190CFC|nr:uncharacterized protein LOC102665768 [Glycine max]|eukprot:XP_014622201.1 uncharacterized protein LOC102665768 [Glycine max]
MARIPDKIKTVDGSKETLKLAMRITDLWFVGVANKSEQAKMVMVDSSGDEIHVVCKQDQLKAWKMDLKENCTYVMHNFRVIKNDGQYKVCDHPYKLAFTGVTIVRQCELDDIIGVVDEIVFCHVSPKSRRVVFKLSDLSDQFLSCTIWDDYCLQFLEYLDEHESESPIIVLLTNARIKEAQGSYPPSVSNSLKASKLANNEPVVQIQEFNQRLSELGIEVRSVLRGRGQGSSQLSGSTQLSSKETFISKSEACSKINVTMLDSNNPAQHESQSISITADHDPVIGLPLTPTKRKPYDECDEARSSQISHAQLSSNKLGKHEQLG